MGIIRVVQGAQAEQEEQAEQEARVAPPVLVAQEVGLERQHLVAPESRAVVAV